MEDQILSFTCYKTFWEKGESTSYKHSLLLQQIVSKGLFLIVIMYGTCKESIRENLIFNRPIMSSTGQSGPNGQSGPAGQSGPISVI